MTKLLLRLFVKDAQNPDSPPSAWRWESWRGGGHPVQRPAVPGQGAGRGCSPGRWPLWPTGVNNLSDAASSVVTLLGFRMAQRPADADHPYGHARYEYISGLVVAALILVIGADLAQSSVGKILHPQPVDTSPVVFGVLIVAILGKLWMSRFFAGLGRHIQSTTLQATSVDSRNDVISSAAVLAGLPGGAFCPPHGGRIRGPGGGGVHPLVGGGHRPGDHLPSPGPGGGPGAGGEDQRPDPLPRKRSWASTTCWSTTTAPASASPRSMWR